MGRDTFTIAGDLHIPSSVNLNHLASLGINGVMHPIKPGIRSGSDTSHLSLLGYDPEEVYTGRGAIRGFGTWFGGTSRGHSIQGKFWNR